MRSNKNNSYRPAQPKPNARSLKQVFRCRGVLPYGKLQLITACNWHHHDWATNCNATWLLYILCSNDAMLFLQSM